MTWVRLDDQFAEDDAVADLSDRAFRLHVIALCYSSRRSTDGRLDKRAVTVVSAVLTSGRSARWVQELVSAGLWLANGDGSYEIKNFLKYNPSAAEVEERRAERNARMLATRDLARDQSHGGSRDVSHYIRPTRPVLSKSFDEFSETVGLTEKQREEVSKFPQELLMEAMNATLQRGADRPAAYFMVLVRKGKVPPPAAPTLPCPKCGLECKSEMRLEDHLWNVHGVETSVPETIEGSVAA